MKKIVLYSIIFSVLSFYEVFACTGTIRGEIHYSGSQTGPVYVAALNLQLDFDNIILLDTLTNLPGEYEFTELKEGNYLIAAFMDVNDDRLPGFTEPLGAHPRPLKIVDGTVIENADVYIKELPRGSGSISGTVHYHGSLTGRIHVFALGFTGTPFNFYCPPAGDSSYTISGLMTGEYLVVAFLDLDDDGRPDIDEPMGFIDQKIKISGSEQLTDYDITLFEAKDFSGSLYGDVQYPDLGEHTIYIFAVGMSHTPIRMTEIRAPETHYEITNLDQGAYFMFAYIDTNDNNFFDPTKVTTTAPFLIGGEPYEFISEPVLLPPSMSIQQDLVLEDKGNAGIAGEITYEGDQPGLVMVAALGLSPAWLGLTIAIPTEPHHYSYIVPYLDAGLYGVLGILVSDFQNPTFDLNTPFGYYTRDIVYVSPADTVKDINFYIEDSTALTSSIEGTITTPQDATGDIYLFSLGLSVTPFWHDTLTSERSFCISDLRMGRYLVGAFMDVNNNGAFDLDEPFGYTDPLVDIPHGDTHVTIELVLTFHEPASATPPIAQNVEPDKFMLGDNYPNPFNPTTTISYQLAETRPVSLKIFSLMGTEVKTLVNEKQQAGIYQVAWNGKDSNGNEVATGIYLYCLRAGDFIAFKRMTLIK